MKIVYVSNSVVPSNTANSIHVMKMCQALSDTGHDVTLLIPNRYKETIAIIDNIFEYYNVKNNFKIKFLKYTYIKYIGILFYTMNIVMELKRIKPNLVYGRDLYGCYLASFQYKTCFEIHAPMDNKIKVFLLNEMIKRPKYTKIIVISNVLKTLLLKSQKLKEKNIIVAHDGADDCIDFHLKIDLKNKKKLHIGYVGSLYKGKGIEVIEKISASLPNMIFHIVGGNNQDIAYWKNKIKSNNVIFHGFISQKYISKYLNAFDICLLPNQNDIYIENIIHKSANIGTYTSPLKMFEYMAAKKTIVASNLPVLREVLNSHNSILVGYNDYLCWIEALKFLELKERRNKFSNQAYKDFQLKYTWKIRAKNILKGFEIF